MAEKNPFEGLDAKPEDFHKEPNPFEGLDLGEKKKYDPASESGGMRVARDLASVGTGALRAGQSLLGTPGDIESYLNIPPPKGVVHWPTTQQIGEMAGELAQKVGLSPDLAKSETPEGKFFEPIAQNVYSGPFGSKWGIFGSALRGTAGELMSRAMDTGETPEGQKSGWRTVGELGAQAPILALSLMKPGNVAAFGPAMERLGTPSDAIAKINRAEALADLAAQKLPMEHVSPWSQLPELYPGVKALRKSSYGGPLTDQAAAELFAVQERMKYPLNRTPVMTSHGLVDPLEPLANIAQSATATRPPVAALNPVARARESPVGDWLKENWNPARWLGEAANLIKAHRGSLAVSDLVQSLASPGAAGEMRSIATYSAPEHIANAIVKSLLALQGGSAPASDAANTITIPRPDISLPSGIRVEIGKVGQ